MSLYLGKMLIYIYIYIYWQYTLRNSHVHVHTHTNTYIYRYVSACVCMCTYAFLSVYCLLGMKETKRIICSERKVPLYLIILKGHCIHNETICFVLLNALTRKEYNLSSTQITKGTDDQDSGERWWLSACKNVRSIGIKRSDLTLLLLLFL